MKQVCVIGLGYVGVPLINLAASKGYEVVGIDTNPTRLSELQAGSSPDPALRIARGYLGRQVMVTDSFTAASGADVVIICVPTPVTKQFLPDLRPLRNACTSLAPHVRKRQLIVLESTVNPGVCEQEVVPSIAEGSELQPGRDFYVAHCPERINPGDPYWHVGNIPRVLGGLNDISLTKAEAFYNTLLETPVMRMGSLREAEAVKIVENSFRDINIAFVNELARSFARLEIDLASVLEGASSKPFGFMPHYPGIGVGGHCIPVDPYYLIEEAKSNGFYHDFLALARRINNDMPQFVFENLERALNRHRLPLKGTRIAVLGLSYKPDIGDTRQSPAYNFIELLHRAGSVVVAYDPHVAHDSTSTSLDHALSGAKAIVLATGHRAFAGLDFGKLKEQGLKIVIDGRNFFDKQAVTSSGLTYVGVGR